MSRLWVAEPMPTPTGTLADERLADRRRRHRGGRDRVVAAAVGVALPRLARPCAREHASASALPRWATAHVAADLAAHRGASAIVAGDRQPPVVHALARMIDHALGNVGSVMTAPALLEPLAERTSRRARDAPRRRAP